MAAISKNAKQTGHDGRKAPPELRKENMTILPFFSNTTPVVVGGVCVCLSTCLLWSLVIILLPMCCRLMCCCRRPKTRTKEEAQNEAQKPCLLSAVCAQPCLMSRGRQRDSCIDLSIEYEVWAILMMCQGVLQLLSALWPCLDPRYPLIIPRFHSPNIKCMVASLHAPCSMQGLVRSYANMPI